MHHALHLSYEEKEALEGIVVVERERELRCHELYDPN
jgi:hypothetical protein